MKKAVACLVVASFLVAAMPRPVNAGHYHHGRGPSPAALGIVAGLLVALVAIPAYLFSRNRGKAIEAKKDVDLEHIKASAASGAKVSCGDVPCENSYESSTAGNAIVRHSPIVVQRIAQNVRSVLPLVSHKNGSSGESALYRAGAQASRNGVEMACDDNTNDYCRGYNAVMEGR